MPSSDLGENGSIPFAASKRKGPTRSLFSYISKMRTKTAFISGHLDLEYHEFFKHYVPQIQAAMELGHSFVVGDARGTDAMAQQYLAEKGYPAVAVFHMFENPRHNAGFRMVGGFTSDNERDSGMTMASNYDIAWVRPGREKSGTAKNIARRKAVS